MFSENVSNDKTNGENFPVKAEFNLHFDTTIAKKMYILKIDNDLSHN